jgi:hypothetical protein
LYVTIFKLTYLAYNKKIGECGGPGYGLFGFGDKSYKITNGAEPSVQSHNVQKTTHTFRMVRKTTPITIKHGVLAVAPETQSAKYYILQEEIFIFDLNGSWSHRYSSGNLSIRIVPNKYDVKHLPIDWASVGNR